MHIHAWLLLASLCVQFTIVHDSKEFVIYFVNYIAVPECASSGKVKTIIKIQFLILLSEGILKVTTKQKMLFLQGWESCILL